MIFLGSSQFIKTSLSFFITYPQNLSTVSNCPLGIMLDVAVFQSWNNTYTHNNIIFLLLFLPVQPIPIYFQLILESKNISLLKEITEQRLKVNAWHTNAYTREYAKGGKTYYTKNENSVYLPNLKGGLNPNENTGNSGY